jgi:hypothetical protein
MTPDDGRAVVGALLAYARAGIPPEETCTELGLVLGWRLWRADSDRLESFVFDTVWPERRPLTAECPVHAHPPHGHVTQPTRRNLLAETLEPGGGSLHDEFEQAPAIGCRCGIYAAIHRTDLPTLSADQRWIGPVALWGTVMEHRRGSRASYAYPLGLEEVAPTSVLDGIEEVTVLFLESDAMIRGLGLEMLRRRGCRVFAVADADEAGTALKHYGSDIDLLVAGIAGREADVPAILARARETRPDAAIVANSGRFVVASLDGRRAGPPERACRLATRSPIRSRPPMASRSRCGGPERARKVALRNGR